MNKENEEKFEEEKTGGLFSEEMAAWQGVDIPREYQNPLPAPKKRDVSASVRRVLRAAVLAPLMVVSGVYILTYILTEILFPIFAAISSALSGSGINLGGAIANAFVTFASKFTLSELIVSIIFALCALGFSKIKG